MSLRTMISMCLCSTILWGCGGDANTATEPVVAQGAPLRTTTASLPFGAVVTTVQGEPIYSNSAVGRPANPGESSFGLRWECVEFVRRYSARRHQTIVPRIPDGRAVSLARMTIPGLRWVENGQIERPRVGDIVVMEGRGVGHVAIVSRDVTPESIEIAQQNTDRALQTLPVTRLRRGGADRLTLGALTGYRTLGWFTRAPRVPAPTVVSHAPLSLRASRSEQRLAIVTTNASPMANIVLTSPSGVVVPTSRVEFTPAGIAFSAVLSATGRWTVAVTDRGLRSAAYTISVAR